MGDDVGHELAMFIVGLKDLSGVVLPLVVLIEVFPKMMCLSVCIDSIGH